MKLRVYAMILVVTMVCFMTSCGTKKVKDVADPNEVQESVADKDKQADETAADSGDSAKDKADTAGQAQAEEKITFAIIGLDGEEMVPEFPMTFQDNMSVLKILEVIAMLSSLEVKNRDGYVYKIGDLSEKDHGPQSGWTFLINGEPGSKGAADSYLKPGDSVVWKYSTTF